MSIIILSIRFALTGAVGNEGNATLTNVSIKQAGTGQSVTIKGETLDEITLNQEAGYGTDDASRRIILNNNVVRYDATYNVTSPGIIELSITLPANNTIDEATIGSAQQCMNGSKLESADITNSDGTVTKSYTNNKATCIRNITNVATGSTLQTNWQITAYPWGSNNEQITPTLAINNQVQATRPEPITVVGRGNYGIDVMMAGGQGAANGINRDVFFMVALYGVVSPETGVLGLAPISDGNYEFAVDATWLPDGTDIVQASEFGYMLATDDYKNSPSSVVHGGSIEANLDNGRITVNRDGAVTGIGICPTQFQSSSGSIDSTKCYYSSQNIMLGIPVNGLPESPTKYSLLFNDVNIYTHNEYQVVEPSSKTLVVVLSSAAYGSPRLWGKYQDMIGWHPSFGGESSPVYVGEKVGLSAYILLNTVPAGDSASNLEFCAAVPDNMAITDYFLQYGNGIILSDFYVEYGVVSSDIKGMSARQVCGQTGDGRSNFGSALDEVAKLDGQVNALRLHVSSIRSGVRDGAMGYFYGVVTSDNNHDGRLRGYAGGHTDQWNISSDWSDSDVMTQTFAPIIVPGLLSHTLTAEPSSTNPGKEDHITITTKTYNKDTNAKITVNLPTGLSIKPGTITIKDPNTGNPIPLIEGETSDYTVSLNTTSTTKLTNGSTITFNLDNIATNHGINLTGYEPIYPGESGVTNIECNTTSNTTSSATSDTTSNSDTNLTCHEVITTNNNNTDDDPINDDLPIAADNNGNGIEHTHTPIEFDVVINEDTPAPSTLTINSTASGTGTDYASSTFKSASDTIAVADPPRTFGYDLTTSSNYVYAGDNLTYNYQVSNLTNNEVTNLDLVTVLPYNDDSRGTTGLIDPTAPATNPYTLTNLTTSLPDGAHLYYTIDTTAVRQIEQGKDTSALISDPSIVWQELDSNTIPTDIASKITALRLSIDNFAMDSKANFSITLTNILANNPTTDLQPSLASDITYLGYQAAGIPTLTSHTNLVKTSYEGNLLVLNPDKTTITTNLNPNEVKLGNGNVDNPDSLTNRLDITARTLNGYTVTMQVKGSDNSLLPISTNNTSDNTNRLIPAINTTPTAGLTGWAISLDTTNANPTWQAVPAIDSDTDQPTLPLAIYQTGGNGPTSLKLPIAYGVSTSQNTIADTYRAEVVYTLTAEL